MAQRKILVGSTLALAAVMGFTVAYAQNKPAAPAPGGAGAAPAAEAKPTCKLHGKACCDPTVTAHLAKDAVFKACGESDATFLGEAGGKDDCKYFFKVQGEKEDDTYVDVYAPAQKEVPAQPTDPFFSYKKAGKVLVTDKAKSPKAAPMLAAATGLYYPAKGYFVSVRASTKVCTKVEATKLASSIK